MKKDIFIMITRENNLDLLEIPGFITNWEYTKEERHSHKDDYGKISTINCEFRFIPYNQTVIIDK